MGIAGESLSSKDLVYLNASTLWVKADPSSYNTVPVVGMAMENIGSGLKGRILLEGFIGDATWSWTPMSALYASGTPGVITDTAPEEARQIVGRAVKSDLIYFKRESVQNFVYWNPTLRDVYGQSRGLRATQFLGGTQWFDIEARPAESVEDYFSGIFDLTALGIPLLLSQYPWYATKTGAGTFTANNGVNEGMRITTGSTINDLNLFAGGDNTGPKYVWNVTQKIHGHGHIKFPGVKTNMKVMVVMYEDANNYFGFRYDTSIDANLHFITKDGVGAGNEEDTDLGAPDAAWHEVYWKTPPGEVRVYEAGFGNITHTTHIPTGNMTAYFYVETLDNVAKTFDFAHFLLNQMNTQV